MELLIYGEQDGTFGIIFFKKLLIDVLATTSQQISSQLSNTLASINLSTTFGLNLVVWVALSHCPPLSVQILEFC
jgi:hypothetical protein